MAFVAFQELFPQIASRETRIITVLPGAKLGVPDGEYEFHEMFCDEPDCDCRRVFFTVLCSTQVGAQAVIAWGGRIAILTPAGSETTIRATLRNCKGPS